jgi:TPR repeat protein
MKKLLLITLTLASYFVCAQTKLTKFYNPESIQRSGFSYQITINVALVKSEKYGDRIEDTYSAELVQLKPTNNSYYSAKTKKSYSCDQLGNLCNPNLIYSLTMNIRYNCDGMESGATGYFTNLNAKKTFSLESRFINCRTPNFYDIIDSYIITCDPVCEGQISKRIDEIEAIQNKNIKNTQNTSTNNNIPSSNSSNPIAKENKQTSTGMPANTSGNDPLANYNDPQPKYSNDKTVEAVGQISNALAPMLEEWANNIEKRREVEKEQQRIYEAKNEKIKANNQEYYQTFFLNKYLSAAENGDEKARMILVCEIQSNAFYKDEMLPNLKNWTIKAANNKNFDAMNIIGFKAKLLGKTKPDPFFDFTLKDGLKMLEEAANMGSLDAMIQLGNYYDYKSSTYGGKDAEKAFYWFSKAAENGSPNGMYYLGMIYRYQSLDKSYGVKYKVTKNDSLAFQWFAKSVANPNYIESLFHKSNNSQLKFAGSYFEINSYKELSIMYEKGIGCEKNIEIANKLNEEYMTSHRTYSNPWGEK